MCTFSPWNPLWALTAKRCGTSSGIVWAVVAAMREDDGMLALLKPHDRVRVLAQGLAIKPPVVALVLAALEVAGVVADGRISDGWLDLDVLRQSESLKTRLKTQDAAGDDRQRALRRARNRRYYLRRKGLPPDALSVRPAESKTPERLNQTPPSLEERDQEQLFPSDARMAKPPGGWGVQAEADKRARHDRWRHNVLGYARDRMSHADFIKLYTAAHDDPRPRWAQAELDQWDRRMREDRKRAPPIPDRLQPEILMPIEGGRPASEERWERHGRLAG